MKVALAVVAASVIAAAPPAFALDTPKSGPSDPRIKVIDYEIGRAHV